MKGDVRIKVSVHIVGSPEPVIAMDGESDQAAPLLIVARAALDQAEAKLAPVRQARHAPPPQPPSKEGIV